MSLDTFLNAVLLVVSAFLGVAIGLVAVAAL